MCLRLTVQSLLLFLVLLLLVNCSSRSNTFKQDMALSGRVGMVISQMSRIPNKDLCLIHLSKRFSNRFKLSLSSRLLNPSQFSSTSSLNLSMSSRSHSSLSKHNLKRSKRKPSPRLIFMLLLLFPISFFCLYLPLLMRHTHHYLLLFTLTRIQPRVRI